MPFAPRFERTVIARSVDGSQPSRSRTGIELPAHSTAPSGSAAARAGNGAPSNGSSSAASQRVHRPGGGTLRVDPVAGPRRAADVRPEPHRQRASGRGGVGVDERGGEQRGLAPAAVAVDHDQPGPDPLEQLEDRLRRRHRAGPDDEVRPMGVDPRPGRTSWSARLTTRDRSCGPVRSPDSGSARIGKPVARARPASAAGSSGSSSGPATMRPRGVRPRSAASSATSSSSRTGRPAMAERERRRRRADAAPLRAVVGSERGVGEQRLAERDVDLDRPAGAAAAVATARPASERTWASVAGSPSNSGSSAYHLAARP